MSIEQRCMRTGCNRRVYRNDYMCCSVLCARAYQDIEAGQRIAERTGDTEVFLAAVAYADAITEHQKAWNRAYQRYGNGNLPAWKAMCREGLNPRI